VQSTKHDDVAASLPEVLWFDASAHVEKLQAYCVAWQGTRDLYLADMFSASRGLKKAFQRRGYRAKAFDINTSYKQDILSENGFYAAVDMIMSFLGGKMQQLHGISSLKIPDYTMPYHTSLSYHPCLILYLYMGTSIRQCDDNGNFFMVHLGRLKRWLRGKLGHPNPLNLMGHHGSPKN